MKKTMVQNIFETHTWALLLILRIVALHFIFTYFMHYALLLITTLIRFNN